MLAAAVLPAGADVLGPVPCRQTDPRPGQRRRRATETGQGADPGAKVRRPALAAALRAAQAVRSARKDAGVVRLQLDPAELI